MHLLAAAAVRAARPQFTFARTLATTLPRGAPPKPSKKSDEATAETPKSADGSTGVVDPAARGVSEMRRQWGGLIDKADREAAAADEGDVEAGAAAEIDLDAHDGLDGAPEGGVDPAARGVSEMRRQWGGLIDEKKK